jgi:hypothetical protein
MKEKYGFGWSDPRAAFHQFEVEVIEQKWEFLEPQPWEPNVRPWLTVLMAYIFIRILL